ncbi:hypothetical protein KY290_023500 [Solanum tuberosum]|uniref:Integrase core domain containing protein n=1 Tax=Solanum tuberosum TaxID=4113 RepID=A0ABQ7V7G4_SOLTU|nr:hypothetical protein KY289_022551 [Solanum tuberosum]KAH0760007.1 hypothetical protein KY290_023500 [Solanum tuberosum]
MWHPRPPNPRSASGSDYSSSNILAESRTKFRNDPIKMAEKRQESINRSDTRSMQQDPLESDQIQVTYRNISPSPTELTVHDLTHFTETARNHSDTSIVPDGFDDFSSPPPPNVYMMSNVSGSSSAQPHKKHKLDSASHAVKYDTPDTRGLIEETMISKGKQPLINPDIDHPRKYGEKQHTTSHH